MEPSWFKKRTYRHLDVPVGLDFAKKVETTLNAGSHSFLPLIRYERVTKRYKPKLKKTEEKVRTIMYPSHRDGCILACYARDLGEILEAKYRAEPLSPCVIAYRKLGKANYHFVREVLDAAKAMAPCTILCFDVEKFFDTLDHALLKRRLKQAHGVVELPKDWFAVFRQMTKFHYVEREALKKRFPRGFRDPANRPIATIEEVKAAGIAILGNPNKFGIPQGTPISAVLSNLYMVDFDAALVAYCESIGAVYRRYCDDILIVCPSAAAADAEAFVNARIADEKIKLNDDKTERRPFDGTDQRAAQYLGLKLSGTRTRLRESSLSRQWRKLRRSVRKTREVGLAAIADGKADKIYTKSLRRRVAAIKGREGRPVRNFSSYARRAADRLESDAILRQVRRLEKEFERELRRRPETGESGLGFYQHRLFGGFLSSRAASISW